MAHVVSLPFIIALCCAWSAGAAAEIAMQVGSDLSRLPAEERTAAAQSLWVAPGTVAWPAPRLTVAEAVAALTASGNPTRLADGVDGARTIALPDGDGEYWGAVLALCAAADLEPVPGVVAGSEAMFRAEPVEGTAVVLTIGPVVLASREPGRPRPVRSWRGPILIETVAVSVNRRLGDEPREWVDLGLRLRFEPRLPPEAIGACRVSWRLESGSGELSNGADDGRPGLSHLIIDGLPAAPGRQVLAGTLALNLVEPLVFAVPLRPGDRATVTAPGGEIVVRLLDDAQAKAEGKQLSGVLVEYPAQAIAREPQIGITVDGKPIASRGGSSHSGGARHERMLYLGDMVDAEHVVRLASALPVAALSFPVRFAIDLAALPDDERARGPAYDRASEVAWPEGECSLAEAIAHLAVANNDVVLDLGVDEGRRARLPAFAGGFWDGALVVCAAFGLGIVPSVVEEPGDAPQHHWQFRRNLRFNGNGMASMPAPIACGPLRLSADASPTPQVCGLVLVQPASSTLTTTRGLDGISRTLVTAVRLRLEPRFARDLVAQAAVTWASHGRDQDGRVVALRQAAPVEGWNSSGGDPLAVTVDGLAAASRRVRLEGLLNLELRRPVRHDFVLSPGASRVLQIGDAVLTVELIASDRDTGSPGMRISGAPGTLDDLEVNVRDEHGRTKTSTGHSTTSFDAQSEVQLWSYDQLADAPHRIQVVGREALADPCLPFAVEIEVPQEQP